MIENMFSPDEMPVDIEEIKMIAIGLGLWHAWDFCENFGAGTCPACSMSDDTSQEDWK